jgi:hypothetical protein
MPRYSRITPERGCFSGLALGHVRCVFNNGRYVAPQKIAASCQ